MSIGMAIAMPRLRGSRSTCRNSLRAIGPDAARASSLHLLPAGCSARSRASISETNTSSSDGTIFSIALDPVAPFGQQRADLVGRPRRRRRPPRAARCRTGPPPSPPGSCSMASIAASARSQRTSSTSSCMASRLERLGRAQGDQLAAVDQAEPVAVLGLVHVVRGDEDRHALARQLVDQVPELAAADRDRRRRSARRGRGSAARGGWRSPGPAAASSRRRGSPVGRRRCSASPAISSTHSLRSRLLRRPGCGRCRCRNRCSPRPSGPRRARTSGSCSRCWP